MCPKKLDTYWGHFYSWHLHDIGDDSLLDSWFFNEVNTGSILVKSIKKMEMFIVKFGYFDLIYSKLKPD